MTICSDHTAALFVEEDVRSIVEDIWRAIPAHFPNVKIDAFVIMPNHVHGILCILEPEGIANVVARHASPVRRGREGGVPPRSLGAIVGSFKSSVARQANELRGTPGLPVWQTNYYEHVIRDEDELNRIRRYIEGNPARWAEDPENPERVQRDARRPGGRG